MTTQAFPLSGPINLHVRIQHGSVLVETADDLTEASVTLEAGKNAEELLAQMVVEMAGPTLTVFSSRQGGIFDLPMFGGRRGQGVDVRVLVPTGTAVKISTHTAPIRIPGRVGGADLAFGSAEAGLREVDGDLRVRFGAGLVKAVRVHGSVGVRSGSGNAQFGEIDGDLRSGTGTGDLKARVVRGAVQSRCGSGSVRLGEVHGDVDLASGSGEMEIGLPAGVSAQLDVLAASGAVHSDMPVESAPSGKQSRIRLRARTGSGDIRLFRAA